MKNSFRVFAREFITGEFIAGRTQIGQTVLAFHLAYLIGGK
jgi:hypothetical protein